MIVGSSSPVHLSYCLNIHPGEGWADQEEAIRTVTRAVKQRVCPAEPLGLGLRLSRQAATDLASPDARRAVRDVLSEEGMYAFTVNGFPYGAFHGGTVKERVYQPDWRTVNRRDYTIAIIDVLADLLPEGVEGSVSTLPGSFRSWINRPDDPERMARNLADCVLRCHQLRDGAGKTIHIGLEPEPACYLETTDECVRFIVEEVLTHGIDHLQRRTGLRSEVLEGIFRRHLGVCLDTCHAAIQFEDLETVVQRYVDEGIRISKVQLSAALEIFNERTAVEALHPFVEKVYLHQVKAETRHGALRSWTDLPDALRAVKDQPEYERIRVHYHVPLFWAGTPQLSTTAPCITPGFLAAARAAGCTHMEVETYTFSVLPTAVWSGSLEECLARELGWAVEHLGKAEPS